MPARFFLLLLEGRQRATGVLLLLAVGITVACLQIEVGGFSPWPWLLAGVPLLALLGSLEPVLVVLTCAEVGVIWAGANPYNFGATAALAAAIAMVRLQEHRNRSQAVAATCGAFVMAGVVVLFVARNDPFIVLAASAAVILAPFGMDVLLPHRIKSGTPRLAWLLGGLWVFLHMAVLQLLLLGVLHRFMKPDRVRRFGRKGIGALFAFMPYGRFDRIGATEDVFEEPCIVVSNHQSSVDIPAILALPGDIRLTLSERVWNAPWLGISARRLGHVVVDDNLLERCREVHKEGASVHFFPEGTRSHDGYPARFHRGAFELAVQLECDVVPVVLCDTRQAVPRDGYWVENYHMSMRVLPRVPPGDDSRALQKTVQAQVRAMFEDELVRINTGKRLRKKVLRHYRYMGWRAFFGVRRELEGLELPKPIDSDSVRFTNCGWGAKVHWLSECFPQLKIVASDPDPDKVAVARRSAAGKPRVTFGAG